MALVVVVVVDDHPTETVPSDGIVAENMAGLVVVAKMELFAENVGLELVIALGRSLDSGVAANRGCM